MVYWGSQVGSPWYEQDVQWRLASHTYKIYGVMILCYISSPDFTDDVSYAPKHGM